MTIERAACKAKVHGSGMSSYYPRSCSRQAVTKDGYCSQHDHFKVRERRNKDNAVFDERFSETRKAYERITALINGASDEDRHLLGKFQVILKRGVR